jgi:hypothetical protein
MPVSYTTVNAIKIQAVPYLEMLTRDIRLREPQKTMNILKILGDPVPISMAIML